MDPIFLQIGPFTIAWYGLLIAGSVFLGSVFAVRLAKERGLHVELLLDSALWLVIAGVIGARFLYVITSPSAFFGPGGNFLDAFKVWQGGLSIHGGILFIVIALYIFMKQNGQSVWPYLDVLMPVAAFGIIGGRLGNIMNGSDTGGRLTNWAIGFTWPEVGTETFGTLGRVIFGAPLWQYGPPVCQQVPFGEPCVVHFTQAYGVLVGVLLVGIVFYGLRRNLTAGTVFWQFVFWYSLLRSVLEEPFRDNPLVWNAYEDHAGGVGLFTMTQVASVVLMLIAVVMIVRNKKAARS